MLIIASILFGLIFGSFIGSTVYRLANDKSLLTPRSYCPHCYRTILWYYNIPFFYIDEKEGGKGDGDGGDGGGATGAEAMVYDQEERR